MEMAVGLQSLHTISGKTTLRGLFHCFPMERPAAPDKAAPLPLAACTAKILHLAAGLKVHII